MLTYGVSGAGWPEFHNGVAAALRLSLGQTAISRTWIVYNKPESANYAHAGVLMGLGLQGHLKVLPTYVCL
jgi:anaphase-promoting complex subunit 1